MFRFVLSKIISFFCRLLSKIVYLCVPAVSKIFVILRLNSRIINQLNKLRSETHKLDDYSAIVSKLLQDNKLIALDVGGQGGFFNTNLFSKKYNSFFTPILVEPLN